MAAAPPRSAKRKPAAVDAAPARPRSKPALPRSKPTDRKPAGDATPAAPRKPAGDATPAAPRKPAGDATSPRPAARKPAARKSAARYHHGDLAQALRDAALAAIAEHGPEHLNLRDLARQLGVSPAAPYRHYADKDALLRAVGADIAARFAAEVERARAEAPADALAQFRAIGIANVRFAVRYPAHFRVLYLPGVIDEQAAAQLGEERAMLTAAQARGELVGLPVDDIALAAGSLVYGLSRLIVDGLLPGPKVTPARADALAIAVTNVLGLGLVPRERPC